jgi:hypothetical protein
MTTTKQSLFKEEEKRVCHIMKMVMNHHTELIVKSIMLGEKRERELCNTWLNFDGLVVNAIRDEGAIVPIGALTIDQNTIRHPQLLSII